MYFCPMSWAFISRRLPPSFLLIKIFPSLIFKGGLTDILIVIHISVHSFLVSFQLYFILFDVIRSNKILVPSNYYCMSEPIILLEAF